MEAARCEDAKESSAAAERLVSEMSALLTRAVGELISGSGARWSAAGAALRSTTSSAAHDVTMALRRGAAGVASLSSSAEAHGRVFNLEIGELSRATRGNSASGLGFVVSRVCARVVCVCVCVCVWR